MTKAKPLPSREELLEYLRYDPETGLLWWVKEGQNRLTTKPAGCKAYRKHGTEPSYIKIPINGCQYYAHRLAWRIMTGEDPGGMQIDHINRDVFDNRWVNLRLADASLNAKNRRNLGGTSPCKGVCFHGRDRKWMASCWVDGKQKHLGYFNTEKEAAEAAAPYHIL